MKRSFDVFAVGEKQKIAKTDRMGCVAVAWIDPIVTGKSAERVKRDSRSVVARLCQNEFVEVDFNNDGTYTFRSIHTNCNLDGDGHLAEVRQIALEGVKEALMLEFRGATINTR